VYSVVFRIHFSK
jgi:hypothetical protein